MTHVKGSGLALCSNSGIEWLRAYKRATRATWAHSLNQLHHAHTTWGMLCIPPPSWSSLGLEGSGPLQQDTQGPRDLALAFLTASLFVMLPFGNTCF